jgi:outer membrane protein assembly factor BamB
MFALGPRKHQKFLPVPPTARPLALPLLVLLGLAAARGWTECRVHAGDQPQWGQAWSRNMVSIERGLPASFDPENGRNVKWVARLGTETHSTPVVAGGRVFIGTNNGEPRDPKHHGDRGVLMCFDERDGALLWQLVVPKRHEDPYMDWPNSGMSSPATVEGDRVYVVSNRGEVLCLDAHGLADGNDGPFQDEAAHMTPPPDADAPPRIAPGAETRPLLLSALDRRDTALLQPGPLDADIVWLFDLAAQAGIWPHDAAHSSILIDGPYLYLNTGTGVDNTHRRIRTPGAPSLIVLDKRTGRLVARENERQAERIFHCTWSSPSFGEVAGRRLIFFCGGEGVVYAFAALPHEALAAGEPLAPSEGRAGEGSAVAAASNAVSDRDGVATLRKVWWFDFDPAAPKENVHRYHGNRRESPSNIYGLPVFHENRVYVAGGGDLFWGKNEAWLKCLDATQTGEVTRTAELWSYPLVKHTVSTPAVHEGLVFIADVGRTLHCLEAATGKAFWTHDLLGETWASPLVADGKVYLGTRAGDFWVFAASKEKRLLSKIELRDPISATATAANGVLYIATMSKLYALQEGATPRDHAGSETPRP